MSRASERPMLPLLNPERPDAWEEWVSYGNQRFDEGRQSGMVWAKNFGIICWICGCIAGALVAVLVVAWLT